MTQGIAITIDGSPDPELANAQRIEVIERWGEPVRYRLHYGVDIHGGDLPLLVDGRLDPGREIGIIATTDSGAACLVKGPVHAQQIRLRHGGSGSELVVSGADNSLKMAREDKRVQWSDVTDSDVVGAIVADYGFIPDVARTDAGHFTDKHSLIQRGSDLNLVRKLARRNGFLFWVSCDASGIETAHFKSPPLAAAAQRDLIINLEAANIDEIAIEWEVERPDTVNTVQLDLNSLDAIEGTTGDSGQPLLGGRGLAEVRGHCFSTHLAVAVDDGGDLNARARGVLTESNWFVRAVCTASVLRVGDVIRSHQIVNLRGAGSRYSGAWFVAGVRHLVDAAGQLMEISLARNGW